MEKSGYQICPEGKEGHRPGGGKEVHMASLALLNSSPFEAISSLLTVSYEERIFLCPRGGIRLSCITHNQRSLNKAGQDARSLRGREVVPMLTGASFLGGQDRVSHLSSL